MKQKTVVFIQLLLMILSLGYLLPAQAITVVASLPALSMIADQLLQGVGKSVVLVDGKQSPHGMALSPSQRQALAEADLVLWVGPEMEAWLVKSLQGMQPKILAVTDLSRLALLPTTAAQQQSSRDHDHASSVWDMHLWLDPMIMQRYAIALRDELILRDPQHAENYHHNTEAFMADLEKSLTEAQQKLRPIQEIPLLTSHDAWRYFFKYFGLKQGAVVQKTPDEAAPVQSLLSLERQLKSGQLTCLLREPQVEAKVIAWLKQRSPHLIEVSTDPLGHANYHGGYPQWLLDQATEIARCRPL